jgi:hypothetical protein
LFGGGWVGVWRERVDEGKEQGDRKDSGEKRGDVPYPTTISAMITFNGTHCHYTVIINIVIVKNDTEISRGNCQNNGNT